MSGMVSKKKQALSQNVKVVVRIRPLTRNEEAQNVKNILKCITSRELLMKDKKYNFDRLFKESTGQIELYNYVIAPLIQDVIAGYNCTVFAYGQTGTGKTYTMTGDKCTLIGDWKQDVEAGIIPRAAFHIFHQLSKISKVEINVKVSYIELYNEEIRDLLSDDEGTLQMYSDMKGSVSIQGLTEVSVRDSEGICKLLQRGIVKRQMAPTLMNHQSSRSHTVFTISVNTRESTPAGEDILKAGKINLVDLAGSENIARSGCKDLRATELANINRSLLTLGRVINALVDKSQKHVPYRDSKLTRILQDSLGGHTKTVIIATVSPAHNSQEETASTLEYATRARDIKNNPVINEKLTRHEMIDGLVKEIDRLQKDLDAARSGTGFYVDKDNYQRLLDAITAVTGERITPDELTEKKAERISNLEEYMKAKVKLFEETVELCKQHQQELENVKATIKEKHESLEQERFVAKWYENHSTEKFLEAQDLLRATTILNNEKEILLAKLEQQFNVNASNETVLQKAVTDIITMVDRFKEEESIAMVTSYKDTKRQIESNCSDFQRELKSSFDNIKTVPIVLGEELGTNSRVQEAVGQLSKEQFEVIRKKGTIVKEVTDQYREQLSLFQCIIPKLTENYETKSENFMKKAVFLVQNLNETMEHTVLSSHSCSMQTELDLLEEMLYQRKSEEEKHLKEFESMVEITKSRIDADDQFLNRIRNFKSSISLMEKEAKQLMCDKMKELESLAEHSIQSLKECASLIPKMQKIETNHLKDLMEVITQFEESLMNVAINLDKKQDTLTQDALNRISRSITNSCVIVEQAFDNTVNKLMGNIDFMIGTTDVFVNSFNLFNRNVKEILTQQIIENSIPVRHVGDTPIRKTIEYPVKIRETAPRQVLIEKFKETSLPELDEEPEILD